jgi:hypothetical protein
MRENDDEKRKEGEREEEEEEDDDNLAVFVVVIELVDDEILITNFVSDDDEIDVVDVTFVVRTASVVVKLVLDEVGTAAIDVEVTEVVDNVNDDEMEEEEDD